MSTQPVNTACQHSQVKPTPQAARVDGPQTLCWVHYRHRIAASFAARRTGRQRPRRLLSLQEPASPHFLYAQETLTHFQWPDSIAGKRGATAHDDAAHPSTENLGVRRTAGGWGSAGASARATPAEVHPERGPPQDGTQPSPSFLCRSRDLWSDLPSVVNLNLSRFWRRRDAAPSARVSLWPRCALLSAKGGPSTRRGNKAPPAPGSLPRLSGDADTALRTRAGPGPWRGLRRVGRAWTDMSRRRVCRAGGGERLEAARGLLIRGANDTDRVQATAVRAKPLHPAHPDTPPLPADRADTAWVCPAVMFVVTCSTARVRDHAPGPSVRDVVAMKKSIMVIHRSPSMLLLRRTAPGRASQDMPSPGPLDLRSLFLATLHAAELFFLPRGVTRPCSHRPRRRMPARRRRESSPRERLAGWGKTPGARAALHTCTATSVHPETSRHVLAARRRCAEPEPDS
ncbi:hypothetical protein JHW43_002901 [Diplocarpon mali]|nr:hypothetical protein JHW43_002901 [Diplocarpon mali]